MRFEVLGPLRVTSGDTVLDLGEPQQQKLLALLLAVPDHSAPTDRLIDEIWPDAPPPSARHLIHVYVARLRAVFRAADDQERIVRDGPGYRLSIEADELDAHEFALAIERARLLRQDDPEGATECLRAATGRWRGRPLAGLTAETPMLGAEAHRLEEMYLDGLEELLAIELDLGHHRELVSELERLTAEHPYRERAWELRMVALYRCGRQAEALQAYHDLRRVLADELGIEPGEDVSALERRILVHDQELRLVPPPPPSNVPSPVSSFVGRQQELKEIARALERARLVTLTGPGGIGKTRLAGEVAGAVLPRFPDGVCWVDLSRVGDPELVPGALAEALGVQPQPGTPVTESIVGALVRRSALILLDNCEHVAAAVAEIVAAVLGGTRGVRVLTTSRSSLHVPGEHLWVVPPLTMPSASSDDPAALGRADAVRLFVERAAGMDATFVLDASNAAAVVGVCRELDGLPLAIEMAAVHTRVLSPAQIADALSDRFALLRSGGPRSRHHSLEAVLDWSYGSLAPDHKRVFDRFSVFAGAFDLEAAQAVAAVDSTRTIEALAALVDASMLTTVRTSAEVVRYRLLETMREYGAHRLRVATEEDAAHEAHADHFLGLAESAQGALGTRDMAPWLDQLRAVYPDLRLALGWSLEHQPRARAMSLGRALFHLWFSTGDREEAGYWGRRMLEGADEVPAALRASAHHSAGFSSNMLGDPESALAHAELAVALGRESGDEATLADALFGRGNVALLMGDLGSASAVAGEALSLSIDLGDRWGRAGALSILGFVQWARGALAEARRCSEEASALFRECGDIAGQVVMCPVYAIAIRQGDLSAAETLAHQALVVALGTAWEGAALVEVAEVRLAQGDDDTAESVARLGMAKALDAGAEIWFRRALIVLARVDAIRDDPERGALLLGASGRNAIATPLDPDAIASVEERCRSRLGDDDFERALERGREMDHQGLLDLVAGRRVAAEHSPRDPTSRSSAFG